MKRLIISFILLVLGLSTVQAQSFRWAKSMGSTSFDDGYSVAVDSVGNVYSTGSFSGTIDMDPDPIDANLLVAEGQYDAYIQKLDSTGNFIWAVQIGGGQDDRGIGIIADSIGNVFVTGYFNGNSVEFDPGVGSHILSSASGNPDVFTAKYDKNGSFKWASQIGGTQVDKGYAIAVDQSGNVYTTGSFRGKNIDFDPASGTSSLMSSPGQSDADFFIQKLDSLGNFIWAKSVTAYDHSNPGGSNVTNGDDIGYDISIDKDGNILTTGTFRGTVNFDPNFDHDDGPNFTAIAGSYITSSGTTDIFVQKLDANGDFVWVKGFGSTLDDIGQSVTTDDNGDIYVAGSFSSSISFGSNNLTSGGDIDAYILKLSSIGLGSVSWVKQMGGTGYDECLDLTIDSEGNLYSIGNFSDSVDFQPDPSVEIDLISNGIQDIFIQKFDNTDNFIWVKHIGSTDDDDGRSIMVDASDNIYTTGSFTDSADFDTSPGTHMLYSNGNDYDIFIQKLGQEPDTIAPVITFTNITDTADGSGTKIVSDFGIVILDDYDSAPIITISEVEGSAFPIGLTRVAIFAKDYSNNISRDTLDIYIVSNSTLDSIADTVCVGSSYTFANDDVVDNILTAFDHTSNLTRVNGGDSVIVVSISVLANSSFSQSPVLCYGDSIAVGDSIYKTTGVYLDTLSAFNGCDSVVTTNLTVSALISTNQSPVLCYGDSLIVGNSVYKESGEYTDTLTADNTCDSIVYTDLTVSALISTNQSSVLCYGDSLIVGSSVYKESGEYTDTLTADNTCDSIVYTDLTVSALISTNQSLVLCYGDSLIVGSSVYKESGEYTDTLTADNTCDSIVYTDLTVSALISTNQNISICSGSEYSIGTSTYSSEGVYLDTLKAENTCDSIVETTLSFYSLSEEPVIIVMDTLVGEDIDGATYRWINCGTNLPVPDETENWMKVIGTGNYALETTIGGCVDTSECVTVAVMENFPEVKHKGSKYVGSAKDRGGKFVVIFEQKQSVLHYYLTNEAGIIVLDVTLQNEDGFIIDLNAFPSGIYYLKAEADGPDHVVKIVN